MQLSEKKKKKKKLNLQYFYVAISVDILPKEELDWQTSRFDSYADWLFKVSRLSCTIVKFTQPCSKFLPTALLNFACDG